MKTSKDFRKVGDGSQRGEQVKGKLVPTKEKKSKRSIYEEMEEDEETGYHNFREKDSVEDYFGDDDEDLDDFGEDPGLDDDYDDEDDDDDDEKE